MQLGKDIRAVRPVSKVAWALLVADFLQRQRNLCFGEYLDDPVCHCFDAEGGADVDWVEFEPSPVELDDGVDLVSDSSNPVELDDGVDWVSESSNPVELDDGVEFFDAPEQE